MTPPRVSLVCDCPAPRGCDPIRDSRAVADLLATEADRDRELFGVVHLDARNRPLSVEIVSMGSLTASLVHPREVFKAAILQNAASVILFHNHPSGDPSPSPQDIAITRRLVEAGNLLGIDVLDHVIIAPGGKRVSFCDDRLLPVAEGGWR